MKKVFVIVLAAVMLICSIGCNVKPVDTEEPGFSVEIPSAEPEDSAPDQKTEAKLELLERSDGKEINAFEIFAELNADSHSLEVTQKLTYVNNTGRELQEIYFNMIPKAFEASGGGVEMKNISVSDTALQLQQVKGTVYKAALPSALAAENKLEIQMKYSVAIPNIQNRFGYQESTYNLGNFIVTPAVYGEEGWAVEPYVDLGDAFYTDIADYDVKLVLPEGYTAAATGEEIEEGYYRAKNVRDFAFCASDKYKKIEGEHGGVSISVYYSGDMDMTAAHAMETAKNSLELCSESFGGYPYKHLNIVMNGLTGGVSGMEYPMLVMIDPDLSLEDYAGMGLDVSDSKIADSCMLSFDGSICHEIAHQWFYGIVGNDQIAEPWLDESICRFSEYLYQQAYPAEVSEDMGISKVSDRIEHIYTTKLAIKEKEGDMYVPETAYLKESLYYWADTDPMEYSSVYDEGASMLYAMQQQMGSESFAAALKEYAERFAYSFVTTDSFKEFWSEKADFSDIFSLYFE